MGLIDKPHTFGNKTDADPSKVNEDFDILYNEMNGNIDEENIIDVTVDQTETTNQNTGSIKQIFDWLVGRVNAIIGGSNWYETPATDLKSVKEHIDASNPHSDSASNQDYVAHKGNDEIHQTVVVSDTEPEGTFENAEVKIDAATNKIWVKPYGS
jgi:hypothetical protein